MSSFKTYNYFRGNQLNWSVKMDNLYLLYITHVIDLILEHIGLWSCHCIQAKGQDNTRALGQYITVSSQ